MHETSRNQDHQGPNAETQDTTPTLSYQAILNRGELFIVGLRKIDEVAQEK